jgi:excisionase family DNA binding protein
MAGTSLARPHGTLADDHLEPLVVRPRVAWRLLDCGNAYGYRLIAAGELESYRDGRARKITVESIRRYIKRRLADGGAS